MAEAGNWIFTTFLLLVGFGLMGFAISYTRELWQRRKIYVTGSRLVSGYYGLADYFEVVFNDDLIVRRTKGTFHWRSAKTGAPVPKRYAKLASCEEALCAWKQQL